MVAAAVGLVFNRMGRSSISALLVALLGLVLGCRSPTQVTLLLSTNEPCANVGTTTIQLGGTAASAEDALVTGQTIPGTCSTNGQIGSFVVTPSGSDSSDFAVQVALALGKETDCIPASGGPPDFAQCIFARREMSFVPHTPLTLPIFLSSSCLGVECPSDQTCMNGACVDDHVSCPSPGGCTLPDAGTDAGKDATIDAPVDATQDATMPQRDASTDAPMEATCSKPDAKSDPCNECRGAQPFCCANDTLGMGCMSAPTCAEFGDEKCPLHGTCSSFPGSLASLECSRFDECDGGVPCCGTLHVLNDAATSYLETKCATTSDCPEVAYQVCEPCVTDSCPSGSTCKASYCGGIGLFLCVPHDASAPCPEPP
jgi:hypothetical protein